MKKIKYVFFAVMFICTLFTVSPALAQGPGTPCSSTDPDAACGGGSDGSSLPVDGHVWILTAAAAVVGIRAVTRKNKTAETAPVKVKKHPF